MPQLRRALPTLGVVAALTACPTAKSPAAPPEEGSEATVETEAAPSVPDDQVEPEAEMPDLPWPAPPKLPRRMRIRGWRAVVSQWRTATTAYANREPEAAASQFLELAGSILDKRPPRSPKARVRRTTRCLAYDNAGAAMAAAGEADRARSLLEAAAERDPSCAASLTLRVNRIGPASATAAP